MTQIIRLALIDPSPFQTREKLGNMETIEDVGLLTPLLVRPKGKRFELIAGHRRLESLKAHGDTEALCEVRCLDDETAAKALYADNRDRVDMTSYERGLFFRQYIERFRLTESEAAKRLGVSQPTISLCLAIVAARQSVIVGTIDHIDSFAAVVTTNKFRETNRLPEGQKTAALAAVVAERFSTNETKSLVAKVERGQSVEAASIVVVNERETRKPVKAQLRKGSGTRCRVCDQVTLLHNADGSHEVLEVLESEQR